MGLISNGFESGGKGRWKGSSWNGEKAWKKIVAELGRYIRLAFKGTLKV